MGVKSIEHYIEKHGVCKGTRIFNTLIKREQTYAKSPYRRLTKEWFIWRYGEPEGVTRWESHVNKSKQSLENFQSRYGISEGLKRYEETLSKKNTVKIALERYGEEYIEDWYNRAKESTKKVRTQESYTQAGEKISKALKQRWNGRSKLRLYIDTYGEVDGPIEYGKHLQRLFKHKGSSKEATLLFDSMISSNPWLLDLSIYYRNTSGSAEWFLSDCDGVFFYDFTVKESKTMLEYDGARWHPTIEQATMYRDVLMDVGKLTFGQAYDRDVKKISRAITAGYEVFVVRSDYTNAHKNEVINQFLKRTKEKCNL